MKSTRGRKTLTNQFNYRGRVVPCPDIGRCGHFETACRRMCLLLWIDQNKTFRYCRIAIQECFHYEESFCSWELATTDAGSVISGNSSEQAKERWGRNGSILHSCKGRFVTASLDGAAGLACVHLRCLAWCCVLWAMLHRCIYLIAWRSQGNDPTCWSQRMWVRWTVLLAVFSG